MAVGLTVGLELGLAVGLTVGRDAVGLLACWPAPISPLGIVGLRPGLSVGQAAVGLTEEHISVGRGFGSYSLAIVQARGP